MTPREKAKELYNAMAVEWIEGTSNYPKLSPDFLIPKNPYVKQCALMAVDEIIETSKDIYDDTISYTAGYTGHLGMRSYWREVKQEIEKL